MAKPGEKIVAKEELIRFIVDCMTKVGSNPSHATQLAEVLAAGDLRGHYSHGLNRLEMYVVDMQNNAYSTEGEPEILKERAGTAWVDGKNLLGPVVGNFCLDLAVEKAKTAGVGWVVAKGSNHYGIAGWYAIRAMEKGCLGMAFTNTSPLMFPSRANIPALGTNPISLAAAGINGDSFVLDMATTTVALGKVEIASRKNEAVPKSWGVDKNGMESTDPQSILNGGGLLPIGGLEANGGYKGYGLGVMVEIFCGILGGAHYGPNIRQWLSANATADLGHCFVAIDPEAFTPGFAERLQDLMTTLRNLPQNSEAPGHVLVPGDPEADHLKLYDQLGGIPYHPNQIDFAKTLAATLGVPEMQIKS